MSLDKKYKVAVFPSPYVDGDVILWYSPSCHIYMLRYMAENEVVKMRSYDDGCYRELACILMDGSLIASKSLEDRG